MRPFFIRTLARESWTLGLFMLVHCQPREMGASDPEIST
jgi:hypothetical protein